MIWFRHRTTRYDGSKKSPSMAKPSQLKSSRADSVQKLQPFANWSDMNHFACSTQQTTSSHADFRQPSTWQSSESGMLLSTCFSIAMFCASLKRDFLIVNFLT